MDRPIEKKRWTPQRIILIIGALAFIYLLLYLIVLRDKRSRLYVSANQLAVVTVVEDKFQEFIPIDGVVLPKTTIFIDAVQGGVVEKIFVEDGALVKKNDPILKLSNTSLELSYMDQETRIYDAINNLQNSKINLEENKYYRQKEIVQLEYEIDRTKKDFQRKDELYLDSLISPKEFEDAKRDFEFNLKQLEISLRLKILDSIANASRAKQIDMSVERMHNNLLLLNDSKENLTIKTPANGKLSSFNVEIGQTKSPGEHLGQIDMLDGYKLQANIDERYVSRVHASQGAECDVDGKTYSLYVNKIYTNISQGSFMVDMFFTDAYPQSIKRGQTLQLRLAFSRPTDAIIIKRGGFFQETGGNWIYVVDPSEKFAVKRAIKLGNQNAYFYEVLDGLRPGEKVIVSSYDGFGNKEKLIFK
ncbi:MAG: efflux transporter periplasmic adaptor subunit [Bacteroidetes bacterium]|nr:efflux transporter periplasmic adaptor subunit [Bacteroidota bacterium]